MERCSFGGFPDRYVNHSCDPNAYEWHEGSDIYSGARRDIAPGEEITFDYNINLTGGTPIPCNCGTERCHGVIFGDFFALPKAIQREYRPLLAHWFVRRYRHLIEALDAEP